MLLGVETNNKRRNVDDLFPDAAVSNQYWKRVRLSSIGYLPNVTLTNENTSVMNTLCQPELVDTSLKSSLQEILDLERQNVIELHAGFVEYADTDQTADKGIAFKKSFRVFLIEGQKLTVLWISLGFACTISMLSLSTNRAARRILDRVSMTRHTSRLLRRPYSPTIFNSASLIA